MAPYIQTAVTNLHLLRSECNRDTGEDVRHGRSALTRAWIVLAILIVIYLAWTLTVYFLEPGLR